MGIVERKIREKEQRRQLILANARKLIIQQGVSAISMQDIANASELSKAALYLYFSCKEDILQEILRDAILQFADYVAERIIPAMSGLEKLRTMGMAYLGFYRESADLFMFSGIHEQIHTMQDGKETAGPNWEVWERFQEMIVHAVRLGMEDGSLDNQLNAEMLSRTIMFMTTSLIDRIARSRKAEGHVQEIKGMFDILLAGLANPKFDRAAIRIPLPPEVIVHQGVQA